MKQFIIILLIIICIASILGTFWSVLGPTPFKTIDYGINLLTKSISIISNTNTHIITPKKQ